MLLIFGADPGLALVLIGVAAALSLCFAGEALIDRLRARR